MDFLKLIYRHILKLLVLIVQEQQYPRQLMQSITIDNKAAKSNIIHNEPTNCS